MIQVIIGSYSVVDESLLHRRAARSVFRPNLARKNANEWLWQRHQIV